MRVKTLASEHNAHYAEKFEQLARGKGEPVITSLRVVENPMMPGDVRFFIEGRFLQPVRAPEAEDAMRSRSTGETSRLQAELGAPSSLDLSDELRGGVSR
jgi:hypothetical protein